MYVERVNRRAVWVTVTACLVLTGCRAGSAGPSASSSESPGLPASIVWTKGSVPSDFNVHTITSAGGLFVALAWDEVQKPDALTRLWLSDDGLNWEEVDVDMTRFGMRAGYFQDLSAAGNGFVAIVKGQPLVPGDPDQRLVVSADARTWDGVDTGGIGAIPMSVAGSPAGALALVGTLADDASGYTYDVWHSPDGVTWTRAAGDVFAGMAPYKPLESIGGRFYVVSLTDGEAPGLLVSSDGSAWSDVAMPPLGVDEGGWILLGSGPGGPLLLTAGIGTTHLWQSSPEGTWTEVTPQGLAWLPGVPDPVIDSTNSGPAMIIGYHDNSEASLGRAHDLDTIWWTTDGASWVPIEATDAFGTPGTIEGAATSGKTLVVYYSDSQGIESMWTGVATP